MKDNLMWGVLLHLSYNMWEDRIDPEREDRGYRPFLRFDEDLWTELLDRMKDSGVNTLVIDLGDGIDYESHPEISVENAWSVKRLREELERVRSLGIEPIPKLNFSTCHDAWLGEYSRCVSTEVYYMVCRDLIGEVISLFDSPRFFHLGMDEETARHQRFSEYVVIRQFDLWWHDLLFLVGQVEKNGSRAWVWSDYAWDKPDLFYENMPKSVLQSNWYYGSEFNPDNGYIKPYSDLEAKGYDQVPTGSNHSSGENLGLTVEYTKKLISPEHLFGFLQTPWRPTLLEFRGHHLEALVNTTRAREIWEDR